MTLTPSGRGQTLLARLEPVIIGIDPSTSATGVGAVSLETRQPRRACTLIPRGDTLDARLVHLATQLNIAIYHVRQDYLLKGVCIEMPEGPYRGHATGFRMGRAYQILLSAVEGLRLPYKAVLPQDASNAIGLPGNASKERRNAEIARLSGGVWQPRTKTAWVCVGGPLDGCDDNALDACAVAMAWWNVAVEPMGAVTR